MTAAISKKLDFCPALVWYHTAATFEAPDPHHDSFSPDRIIEAMRIAAREVGFAVTGTFEQRYEPQGLSSGIHGPRFRMVLHTWPEHALTSFDLAVLEGVDPKAYLTAFGENLGWQIREAVHVDRKTGVK